MTTRAYLNNIPKMTGYLTNGYEVFANPKEYSSTSYRAWEAFDNNSSTRWLVIGTSGKIGIKFPERVTIGKYSMQGLPSDFYYPNRLPKNWTFEGSSDSTTGLDGTWAILDTQVNQTGWGASEIREYELQDINLGNFLYYRINITANNGGDSYVGTAEIEFFEIGKNRKTLVLNNSQYKKYSSSSWQTVTSITPTESNFLQGNSLEEIALIPELAWQELTGTVELCYYTDDTTLTEAQFNIETEPFTLADEFEGKQISIIEYTDNPSQVESVVETETEPYSIYDEFGDTMEVLYYTDDPDKTSSKLEITANYSPLDEIDGDFEVVTWTDTLEEATETLVPAITGDVVDGGSVYATEIDLTDVVKIT